MNYTEFRQRYHWNGKTDKLGEGGFGKVYQAMDVMRSRSVVIKIADVPTDHKFSLQREVDLNRDLTPHPNIAQYRNCYRFENEYNEEKDYATMDYFSEGSLSVVMSHPLNSADIRIIVIGILRGLFHLEKEKVIHRDLKPANVLMDRDAQGLWLPKIADFGLSRFTNAEIAVSNSSVGISYDYAAPEQFLPGSVNRQADLWSFGVLVYRLCTGKLPFDVSNELTGESRRIELIRLINQAHLPADINQIEEPYQQVIRWCLVKDLDGRVKSAGDLLDLFETRPVYPKASLIGDNNSGTALIPASVPMPSATNRPLPKSVITDTENKDSNQKTSDPELEPRSIFSRYKYLILLLIGFLVLFVSFFIWRHQAIKPDNPTDTFASGAFGNYTIPASAIPTRSNPSQLVNDYTNSLTKLERERLERKIQTYNITGLLQIVLVVVKTTRPYPIKNYAVSIGNTWRIGQNDKDNGVVIVWAAEDKELFIATSNSIRIILSDVVVKEIIDQKVIPLFRKKRYYTGLNQAIDAIINRSNRKGSTSENHKQPGVLATGLTPSASSTQSDTPPVVKEDETSPKSKEQEVITSTTEPPIKEDISSEEIYTVVEEQPQFPGGMAAFGTYIANNLRYPAAARQANVSGRVYVSFVVNTDGSIQDVNVLKGLGSGTDEEAQRLMRDMPKWRPGKQSGRPVRVKFNFPVVFSLE